MISKQYFEETFNLDTAQNLQTWADNNLITQTPGDNPYLEPVNIPIYDSGDTSHVLITTSNGNWSLINDASKQHFYVEPGYYGYDQISITTSGTAINNRTISLHNGNDTHPGQLASNELAEFRLLFNTAKYWTVDRPAFNRAGIDMITFYNQSTHNVINRAYTNDCGRSIFIRHLCHNNTIQNSRFNYMNLASRLEDQVCILLLDYNSANDIFNTKIIANEFRNQNDAIMTMRRTDDADTNNYEGTIIDSNDIYIDNTIYTDGNGNLDTNGLYSESEDALDLKVGSLNASNPMIITNNHMWGLRSTDMTNHLSNSRGDCMGIHYGVGNTVIENNVFFDSNEGVVSGDNYLSTYSMFNASIKNNIFADILGLVPQDTSKAVVMVDVNDSIEVENNTFKDCVSQVAWIDVTTTNSTFINNVTINQETSGIFGTQDPSTTVTPNTEYTTQQGIDNGYTEDYVFTTDKYTNSPRVITIENVVKL